MADTWTVLVNSLLVRSAPNTNGAVKGSLYKGNTVQVDQVSGAWVHHDKGGWSCSSSSSGKSYMSRTTISPEEPSTPVAEDTTSNTVKVQEENLKEYTEVDLSASGYEPDWAPYNLSSVYDTEEYLNNIEDDLSVSNCRGIHGMPYQFMPIADTRISSKQDSFGIKYAEKIVARMPILCITPGLPVFLEDYNDAAKKRIKSRFLDFTSDNSKIDELLSTNGKFYSIKFAYKEYYSYVNALCRQAAFLLGIENEEINGTALKYFDWGADTASDLSKIINYTECVAFYIDSDKSINENFNNDTTDSSLKGLSSGMSDLGREAQFYFGTINSNIGGALDAINQDQNNLSQNMQVADDFITNIMGKGNGNIFRRITGNVQTLVSGGRLIFPEIWSDSSFSRSYSVNQTLVSPDTDDLSIYLNILVPMFHWIGLAAPRASLANGYIAPYIVKAFYKGQYNIDMGMITGLNFVKGDEGSWTRSGLPTIVKVSADIKDLYSAFSISNGSGTVDIFNNTILMDYIANLCGVNINEPDVYRNIEMYLATQTNKVRDAIRFDIFRGMEQHVNNSLNRIYRKVFF